MVRCVVEFQCFIECIPVSSRFVEVFVGCNLFGPLTMYVKVLGQGSLPHGFVAPSIVEIRKELPSQRLGRFVSKFSLLYYGCGMFLAK